MASDPTRVSTTEHPRMAPPRGREQPFDRAAAVTDIAEEVDVAFSQRALSALARELKRRCGTGGTSKDGVIEIQGDHRDVLVEELERRGYTVKRAGG